MKIPTVLLVEDSEDDVFFFKRTLEKSELSCALRHVWDGAEAIEFLQKASRSREKDFPRKMFLDLKMPLVNGFEVLEWLRTQTFADALQVIVLSGSEQDHDKQRAAQLGAADYLIKPVRTRDLHRILQPVCPPQMGAQV